MRSWPRYLGLLAALVLLNTAVTFENVWPTPAVTVSDLLSVELAVSVLAIGMLPTLGVEPRRLRHVLAGLWAILAAGHYADVTAPALYGRDVNLYWDVPHVSNVAAMLAKAASPWLVAGVVLAGILGTTVLFWLLTVCWAGVADAMARRSDRWVLTTVSAAIAVAFFVAPNQEDPPGRTGFAAPVTASYARHVRLAVKTYAARGTETLSPSPALDSDLSAIEGADVLLIFIESYGATAWERPEYSVPLEARRADLESAIRETGRDVVSAYVESPTFGGVSWLAHISLLSGLEIRDQERNAVLMAQKRDTLVTAFSRQGYRTVAVMPGLWQTWPEGAFYGFDDIYGGERLEYQGPAFGWWAIPDQYTLAHLDELELSPENRRPVFAFFPTVNTHAPFSPTPPYQPDWSRVLTDRPYDEEDVNRAWEQWVDWLNLGPSYVRAVSYTYTTLAGYLRERPRRDVVMILIGDHQPPAAVSGTGAAWDVPVHVITSRPAVLTHLAARGFRNGLTPRRPRLGQMNALLPVLWDAFGEKETLTVQTTRPAQQQTISRDIPRDSP